MRRGAGGAMKRSTVAVIDEARCIGCTLCIAACPVDAISGASGLMHTVIEQYCIGCDLCVPPCPVDCIAMVASQREWTESDAAAAKRRARQRKARLAARAVIPPAPPGERRATVAAAVARVRARRAARGGPAA
jgi:electron transport complex protein RnfB